MLDIWHKLLRDMRLVIGHDIGTLMLIYRLRDDNQPTSSSDNEVLDATPHHDSLPSHGLGG